jgi:poly(ribitol-phosphate) beta-N-acetylglucosaminyltransferase
MVKVSVIVPVFEPGERIDRCIESLLEQSMAPGEYEVIFVDDGSQDGTAERLEALAAEHEHVTTVRIPHTGWPGRPRNVGIERARGEFVYFVDHDDWIGREALERLHATAIIDEADIVIGKVVGHNRRVPRSLFRENVHQLGLRAAPFNLLTPHKLFRRSLLEEHGIRFPEGRRRLEDHMMVVPAYFRARNMAILADYPCYHWVNWQGGANASYSAPDPADYFADVREVLDLVDAHTEPGEFRDALYGRWYRSKLLGRLGRNAFLGRDAEHRRGVLSEVRTLMEERFPPRLDHPLVDSLRLRAALARRGDYDGLVALAELERDLKASARVRGIRGDGTWMSLALECWLRDPEHEPFGVVRRDGRILLDPPARVRERFEEHELDVTETIRDVRMQLLISREGEETDWIVPAEIGVDIPDAPDGEPVRPAIVATARIAPTIAAGGRPLAPGDHDLRAVIWIAGFSAHALARRGDGTFGVTVTPAGRIYRRGSVPEPPPAPTPKQRARRAGGRLLRRMRGPRAAAAAR